MRLYDTLTRSQLELPPPPGPIGTYVCGSTVYQRVHVGNSRPFVLAMWLRSWLREKGYDVTLVHNITDVDDKVYAEAGRQGIGSRELSERATAWFFEDTDDLGLGRPDVEPRATETIPEIVAFIQELIERDLAYEAGGDVYFSVARWPDYGRLSGARLDEMISQEASELKRDQRDFALWKSQKPSEDAAWDSPWGRGRPGWHIECSAMAEKYLGPEFEIHGGGLDLRFPHHENELAQSSALGHRFAHVWMHNGMLELDAEKMSKSLGNVVTLRSVLDTWGREALLVFHLTGHWSKPVDFSDEAMDAAAARADGFREVFRAPSTAPPDDAWDRFSAALDDDFNTPAALAVMHEWRNHELLRRALAIFGLESLAEEEDAPGEVVALAERRIEARTARDFDEADRLRSEIEDAGWEVRDESGGFRLVRRR
ncbi:MAG: cysteine--tRNA ligase [Gaiellaceae bacterium]